jgi:uncharacterized protein
MKTSIRSKHHLYMMIRFFLAAMVVLCLPGNGWSAPPTEMGIVTGGPAGTYYQFGLNLQALGNQNGIDLRVDNSNGSIENIYAVYQRPKTQLGIVQSDVLAFVSRVQSNPVLQGIARKTKLVFPLYNEEIHLVGKQDILGFDYLTGRKVAIGQEGSGTYMTAELLFNVSGVEPAQKVAIGTEEALEELKRGNIDAMFYVAGYPVKLFSENIQTEDNLALIPITHKSILEFYPESEIPAGTYAWQTEAVPTAAVKAVLVAYDFRNYHCDTVGKMAKLIYENMDWLSANGHPKWQSVDLNYQLKGWEQYDCVQKALAGARKPVQNQTRARELNPVLDALKEMLSE